MLYSMTKTLLLAIEHKIHVQQNDTYFSSVPEPLNSQCDASFGRGSMAISAGDL